MYNSRQRFPVTTLHLGPYSLNWFPRFLFLLFFGRANRITLIIVACSTSHGCLVTAGVVLAWTLISAIRADNFVAGFSARYLPLHGRGADIKRAFRAYPMGNAAPWRFSLTRCSLSGCLVPLRVSSLRWPRPSLNLLVVTIFCRLSSPLARELPPRKARAVASFLGQTYTRGI